MARRLASLAVLTLVIVVALQSAAMGQTTIDFAHGTTGGAFKTFLDTLIEEFEAENPGVVFRQNAMKDEIYETTGLLALFQAQTPPDLFFQWGGWLVERDATAGYSADLTDFVDSSGLRETMSAGALADGSYNGRVHLIPRSIDITNVIWYNEDIFAQQGVAVPSTWDEFINACSVLSANGIIPIAAGNKGVGWPMGNWGGHIAARVVGEQKYHDTLSLEPGTSFADADWVKALGHLAELVDNGCFNVGVNAIDTSEAQAMFFVGAAAMHPIGSWLVPSAKRDAPSLSYDAFNTPAIPDGKGDQTSITGVTVGYSVGATSTKKEEVLKFLAYLSTPEVQRRQVRETGTLSPVFGTEDAAEDRQSRTMISLLNGAGTIVAPPDTGYELEVAYALYNAIAKVMDGIDPETALREADQAVAHLR